MVQLVTGGAGFIGSHLVDTLVRRGHEVVVFDNLVRGKREHVAGALKTGRCVLVDADCSDQPAFLEAARSALSGRQAAAIWHMAANSDIPAGIADPRIDLRDTFMTTFNALSVMRELSIPDFHFASSSAVYGDFGSAEIREDSGPCKPISNYGAMKLASEAQICAAIEVHGSKANIFRFPNVVGTPATHGVIYDLVNKLRNDPRRLTVLGDGTQQKAYLHVAELVEAMVFITEKDLDKISILNIGPRDAGVTVRFIAECVRNEVSPFAEISYGEGERGWVGDVPHFRYATTQLAQLGWEPSMSSEDAVRLAVRDIARQARAYRCSKP